MFGKEVESVSLDLVSSLNGGQEWPYPKFAYRSISADMLWLRNTYVMCGSNRGKVCLLEHPDH